MDNIKRITERINYFFLNLGATYKGNEITATFLSKTI